MLYTEILVCVCVCVCVCVYGIVYTYLSPYSVNFEGLETMMPQ